MVRKLTWAASLWACVVLGAGCGHDGIIDVNTAGGPPPEPPAVTGAVLAPNGEFAAVETGWWRVAASFFTSNAYALVGVDTVGAGVSVTLYSVAGPGGQVGDPVLISSPEPTDTEGHFSVALLNGHEVGECGLLLSVGKDATLTRALVYIDDQDVDAVSEAVVRSILNYIAGHPDVFLCDYSADDIGVLTAEVDFAARDVSGTSVFDINRNAYEAAQNDAKVQQLLEELSAP